MAAETHKLQDDPPEGSREVVDHELKRQAEKGEGRPAPAGEGADRQGAGSGRASPQDR